MSFLKNLNIFFSSLKNQHIDVDDESKNLVDEKLKSKIDQATSFHRNLQANIKSQIDDEAKNNSSVNQSNE